MKKSFFLSLMIFLLCQSCNKQERKPVTDEKKQIILQDSATWAVTAALYHNSGRFSEAIIEYDKLIGIDSTNGKYLYRKAYCLMQIDSPAEAIRYFNKAAEVNFYKFDCFYSIGLNALILHDDSLAIQYFEKCLLMKPDSKEVQIFLKNLKGAEKSSSL